jgi:hypothetical protein
MRPTPSTSRHSHVWTVALAVPLACVCSLLLGSTASAADFTWSGGGGSTAEAWSNGANWLGDSAPAPSSSIGNLTFPLLLGQSFAANDLSGLSINHLSIDDTNGYALNGQGFTLGSGGLSINETAPGGREFAQIYNPITLSSDQTWDISGRSTVGQTTEEGGLQALEVVGALSGEAANLTLNLHNPNTWFIVSNTGSELGNVRVIGSPADAMFLHSDFNSTDGKTLTVEGLSFTTENATGPLVGIDAVLSPGEKSSVGPLTSIGSRLVPGGVLHLPSASFDPGSTLEIVSGNSGTEPGTDYTQLAATGPIDLGGASLELKASIIPVLETGQCPAPTPGQVYTLVSTTGTLSGSFGNAPNGSTIMETECLSTETQGELRVVTAENSYPFRINYNTASSPETVTATALESVPGGTEPPAKEPEKPTSTGGSNPTNSGTGTSGGGPASVGSIPPVAIAPISPAHPAPKPLTVAQKLARALKQCKHDKPVRKRKVCEAKAKKRYKVKKAGVRK